MSQLRSWDAVLPEGFAHQSVHELLVDQIAGLSAGASPAALLAVGLMGWGQASAASSDEACSDATSFNVPRSGAPSAMAHRRVAWIDSASTFYPPAAVAAGIPAKSLYVIRPKSTDVLWAATECLRCPGIGVVIAALPGEMTRVQARRLQLAAEQGGGIGLLLRTRSPRQPANIYAAATRWLVSPTPGDHIAQRWNIQLIHGHGGRLGQSFILEVRRGLAADASAIPDVSVRTVGVNARSLHSSAALADYASAAASVRAIA